ncbi:uncharacterized protein J3R85_000231 [Psidium guajava]|nr:uncharacterized protein J3R85_000231 [Psidium guajava]
MRKPCCDKQKTNKGAWSEQEDQTLINYVRKHGEGNWNSIPRAAGLLRCGKSCRLRWLNYLRPDLKRGNFGEDEDDLIIKLHALLGNRWSLIAGRLPGRTDNEVKNYWNSHLRRKLLNKGVILRRPSAANTKSLTKDKAAHRSSAAISVEEEGASLDDDPLDLNLGVPGGPANRSKHVQNKEVRGRKPHTTLLLFK